ncbi:MAG: serine protease [Thermodesulfobacteriota bacterium]|nr:serine protease [Thermodesulfobacteriota bacterium]
MKQFDIIVSLWNGSPNNGKYLGCGVCIAPDRILTAKHLVKDFLPTNIFAGLIPDRDSGLPVKHMELHQERDVSVLTLARVHKKQAIPCNLTPSLKQGKDIQLLAYNKTEKCTKGPIKVDLSNWVKPCGWEFHTQPVPGMSGGAALRKGQLVGIIQARDNTENSGIIIPLDAIKDFLAPFLRKTSVRPEENTAFRELPRENGSSFKAQIARRIQRELRHQDAEQLRKGLLEELGIDEKNAEKASSQLADKLLAKEVDKAIRDYLVSVTIDCIYKRGLRYEESRDKIDGIKEIAEELLGWLVLSSVDEKAIAELLPDGLAGDSLYFVLGHGTLGGVELAMSGRFHRKAEWLAKESPSAQQSPYHVHVDPRYFTETDNETVRKLLLEIWNKVFDSPEKQKKESEELTAREIRSLNETLRDLRKRKRDTEHYYIAFHLETVEPEMVKEIFRKLLSKLNQMTVVEFGSQAGSKVLVMDEEMVIAAINGFYRAVNKQDKSGE